MNRVEYITEVKEMRIVIQKVLNAKVVVEEETVGAINNGYMLLVGLEEGDTLKDCERAASKIANIRLFEDEDGKINRSIHDVNGEILAISQFTLAADSRKGNRPSFSKALSADVARDMFSSFVEMMREEGLHVETGVFQAHMNVILDNDGPVTIILDIKDGKVV